MNTQEQERSEGRLREALAAAYPASEPPDDLRRRVAALAARHEETRREKTWRWARLRLRLALAGAATLALLTALAWPSLVAAQTLRRMGAVMSDARTAHLILWNVGTGGARVRSDETWYDSGRWRIETDSPRRVQVFAAGKLWSYQPEEGVVRVQRRDGPFAYNGSGFSLSALVGDMAQWGWKDRIRVLGETTVNGRAAREVVIDREAERVLLWADARTDLPFHMEAQRKTLGGYVTGMVGDMEYNRPLPPALFVPDFPKTARVVNLDRGRQAWEDRLAQGIASRRVGDRTLVIRDLQVNAQGDVFVLYTAGKFRDDLPDWDVDVTDEYGTRYLPIHNFFRPYTQITDPAGPVKPGVWQGFTFDGVKLEGNWWTPATPPHPWKPRRLTLTFHVAPHNAHGGWRELWGHEPITLPNEPHTGVVSLTRQVDQPTCAVTPDYMPYMGWRGLGGVQSQDVAREDADARQLDDWDQTVSQADRTRNHDPLKALELYRQAITKVEQMGPGRITPGTNTYAWLRIYQILRGLGRRDEARAALAHARDEAIVGSGPSMLIRDGHWTQVEAALRQEGMP